MGLFSRFRKKKEKSDIKPNEEPKIFLKEDDDKNIIFRKMNGSNEVNATREEAEEAVTIIKEKYANELEKPKINVMGQDIEIDILKDFNQKLDDAIIENYGTDEEIAKLNLKQTIKNNEEIANKLKYGTEKEKNRAIKIYEHNIEYGVPCNSYSDLARLYQQNREYDKAIEIANKGIEVFSKYRKDETLLKRILENCEMTNKYSKYSSNNQKGEEFENQGKIDEAINCYQENINLNADTPFTYYRLSSIYHKKKDFESERDVLKKGIKNCQNNPDPSHINSMENSLKNVNSFLEMGEWEYDCLPSDSKNLYYDVKEAKTLLNGEDKEKGVMMLENLMANGSYNNTVYYTLYQTYKKDKNFDDAIRVCEKAIENLGFFSNDRKSKWTEYHKKLLNIVEK